MAVITRREFIRNLSCAAVGLAGASVAWPEIGARAEDKMTRPNFVFVLADDWGWGDLGCFGNDLLKTPNLDKLASQGTIFTQFYVNGSVCSPTRAGIMTGRFPARHRIFGHFADHDTNAKRGMPNWLDPNVTTLTDLLKQAGYVTGHFGKWHLGAGKGAPEPKEYGVDDYRVFGGNGPGWNDPNFPARSSELIVDESIRFIQANRDKPFFVNVWLKDTHAFLDPTEEQMAAYPNLKGAYRIYCSAATNADKQLGGLFAKLDELGLSQNTVVIFTGDNGPEDIRIPNASHSGVGSAGPFRGRKRSLYEGGIRTPFIIRWPGVTPAGKVDNSTVLSGVDMLPTICTLAGIGVPADLRGDGEELSAALKGSPKTRAKALFWEFRFYIYSHTVHRSPMIAVREGDWKLLTNPDRSRIELYNIPKDPTELTNRAEQKPEIAKKLTDKALEWFKTLPEAPIEPQAGKNDYPWPKATP